MEIQIIFQKRGIYTIAEKITLPFKILMHVSIDEWSTDNNGTSDPKDDKNYIKNIVIELKRTILTEYYHLTYINYCKIYKEFEIHIEKVSNPNNGFYIKNYSLSVNHEFDLTGEIDGNIGEGRQVKILIYNKSTQDKELFICKKREKFPKLQFPDESQAILPEAELHPETHNGNILVGKN